MLFSARIKELEAQVETLTTERDEAVGANSQCQARFEADQATIAALTGERDGARTERDEARTQLETVTGERDQVRQELQTEREGRESAIADEVNKRLAAAGAAPIKRDAKAAAESKEEETKGLTGMAKARAYFATRQPKEEKPAND